MLPLPAEVSRLLESLDAPRRLVAHLILVHDTACSMVAAFDQAWPALTYDREAVRLGAAIHDIGKITHPDELRGPGHAHEAAGESLLLAQGWPEHLSRFARTHGQWSTLSVPPLEDLLVALADNWWRGRRDEVIESAVCAQIAAQTHQSAWQVYLALTEIADVITSSADERLRQTP